MLLLISEIAIWKWKYKYVHNVVANTRYDNDDAIQPNNLFGISLFRQMALYSFGNKKLEDVENVYLASLMYKLLSDNEEDMMCCI